MDSILVKLALIFSLFIIAKLILKKVVKKLVKVKDARKKTLTEVFITTGNIFIYGILLITLLDLFGIDTKGVLAGAGIIGFAIGFGAQSLIKDFISGIFILSQDQFRVGDKVKIGNIEGEVVKMNLKTTVIKDDKGAIYYVSNGYINNNPVKNYSKKSKRI